MNGWMNDWGVLSVEAVPKQCSAVADQTVCVTCSRDRGESGSEGTRAALSPDPCLWEANWLQSVRSSKQLTGPAPIIEQL